MSPNKKISRRRTITRRDFLNGVALGLGSTALPPSALALADAAAEPPVAGYPPALTGMRGNHDGSFTYAHRLRDSGWGDWGSAEATGETYDLVVVGAGISGLAAADFFRRRAARSARVLILDNHDDFGGHARRNEFQVRGRTLLAHGGTMSIEGPRRYSRVAAGLLAELGIDLRRFYTAYDRQLYADLGTAMYYDKATFGADRLVTGMGRRPWPQFLDASPLTPAARRDIARLYTERKDYLAGLSRAEKIERLTRLSYADYLTQVCGMTPEALPFFQTWTHDLYTVGIDAVPALYVYASGDDYKSVTFPGFDGLGLGALGGRQDEPYIFHFPDGNASIARLLVRRLVPGSIPGHDMEDIVTARADYARLDRPGAATRIRLNSTVVHVARAGAHDASPVDVTYVEGGRLRRVSAAHCILACYNAMIPHLCPDLPQRQKSALHELVKMPLVYTHVAIDNWRPFQRLGVQHIVSPGSYHSYTRLDFPVSLGRYRFPSRPDEPMVLLMLRTPCHPGLPSREQNRLGRAELLATSFATFEERIRDQLGAMLGPAGFDPARDIHAITVNRWAHGYAFSPNPLFDPDWPEGQEPWVLGRARFGRIAIANSDAAGMAETDAAIDQAWRAVGELLG